MRKKVVAKKTVEHILCSGDIEIGGKRPQDIIVHNEDFYRRVLTKGTLGLGESYMDGWWDGNQLDEFFFHGFRRSIKKHVRNFRTMGFFLAQAALFNAGHRMKAFIVGEKHYDVGNDLYKAMLDKRMVYTCGYWENAKTLDEAQEAKLDLICKKINLKPGMRVLDIGGGWGSFAKFAAEKYGAEVVAITVSKEQKALGDELCRGLPVEIRLEDYRDTKGTFDAIVSLGMFEHVGYKNYRTFMKKAHELLADDGLFLLHTIGGNKSVIAGDPWMDRYIFPGGMIPSIKQIGKSMEKLFVMEDWHNFGSDYDKTLMQWFKNFDKHWPKLEKKYGKRFYRMWEFYLMSTAGYFRAREGQLWQIVLSKRGVLGGYKSVR